MNREYYQKNKERILAWREKNRERLGAKRRAWYAKNIVERREKRNRYLRENPDVRKANCLKVKYGLGLAEWEKMMADQSGRCKICGSEFSDGIKPVVDHNHRTKKVRGLLCIPCNLLLGSARDSIEILSQAINYLDLENNKNKTEKNI